MITSITLYLLVAGVAAIVTVSLTPVMMVISRRLGLVDVPNARKAHRSPVPRIGGPAIAAGVLVGTVAGFVMLVPLEGRPTPEFMAQIVVILGAALLLLAVGMVDDVRTVSSRFKMVALFAAAAAVCGTGARFDQPLIGGQIIAYFPVVSWAVTMLWIVTVVVSINFIDGLDGLAAGLTLLASAVLAFFLILFGFTGAAILPLALAAALGGFLIFNWHPAKIFMGDSGSMTIGFICASMVVVANPMIGTLRAAVLPSLALSIPLIDTAVTMFRRKYIQRQSIFASEWGHIHHKLIDRGMKHSQAVLTIHVVSLAAVGMGMMSLLIAGWGTLAVLLLLVPLLVGLFRLAGSVRTSEMISAVRRKRAIDRELKKYQLRFEEMQLEFRRVSNFSEWWQNVCRTAAVMEFARLELPVVARDGSQRTLIWTPSQDLFSDCERLEATVPIRQRRQGGEPLRARVEVCATTVLEAAGSRVALFSRLMSDHSIADIKPPDSTTERVHEGPRPPSARPSAHGLARAEASGSLAGCRIAVVHDCLYTYAGAEKVLEQILTLFPNCDLFALFDVIPDGQRAFLQGKSVTTTFLQRMPRIHKNHRLYLPLMPLAIEQLDLSAYDIVVTSSYLAAKGVITGPNQLHICYCHSPVRYAWDLQHQYLNQSRIGYGPGGLLTRWILHYIRNWDARSALGVDVYLANSDFVARRIHKVYRRRSEVIHPPVDTGAFSLETSKDAYYVTASRLVSYKRIDLIVEAFNRMPDRQLLVIGEGPESERLAKIANPNVTMLGYQSGEQLRRHLQHARAFLFAAEEDFGIAPVEAMACGTPVIAYGEGGVVESVVEGRTGVFFDRQRPDSIVGAVERFEHRKNRFDPAIISHHAKQFGIASFREQFLAAVEHHWQRFQETQPRRVTEPSIDDMATRPADEAASMPVPVLITQNET